MRKAIFLLGFVLGLLIAGTSLQAETVPSLGLHYSPVPVSPGSLLVFYVRVPEAAASSVLSLGSAGNPVRQFKGFSVQDKPGLWVVITAFGSLSKVEDHQATLTVRLQSGKTLIEQRIIPMQKRDFLTETIPLNASNTAIRTEPDPRKTEQAKRLSSVLLGFDPMMALSPDFLVKPVQTERKTSFFGDRRIYTYSNGKQDRTDHKGIDYGVPTGTPVLSGLAGRVVLAEDRITTGNTVVIEFGPGLFAQYYHLNRLDCKTGDIVGKESQIGLVGATGLATGPHLHYELQCQGVPFDPEQLFDKAVLDIEQAYKVLFPVR